MRKLTRERGPWETEGETERKYRDGSKRPIAVIVEPRGVRLKPKGTRTWVWVSWQIIYLRGCELAAYADGRPYRKPRITRGKM